MTPATLDHEGIAARVPHSGSMCLLHGLLHWDAERISCSARSHRDATNPLRTAGGLLAPVAIEYASQAMALHGTLSAAASHPDGPPQPGFLAAVRGVKLLVARLDTVDGDLLVTAQRLMGDAKQALYAFTLHSAAGALLVEGRATVILNALP
jgi:predicted hotdog family 3-hydroxylacyl-ACP dehydratase